MRSWRAGDASVVAYPGAAKYSCLSALDSRRISLLIERHNGARSSFDIGESQFLPCRLRDAPSDLSSAGVAAFIAVVPPSRPKAAPSQKVVTATCENATDCTDELQAAFASGAETVHVPRLHGGQRSLISPLCCRQPF